MTGRKPWTATKILALKGREKFACVTVFDYFSGRLADEAGLPLLLVGDSLGMTVLGYSNTLAVTLDQMIHHAAAATRAVLSASSGVLGPVVSPLSSVPCRLSPVLGRCDPCSSSSRVRSRRRPGLGARCAAGDCARRRGW